MSIDWMIHHQIHLYRWENRYNHVLSEIPMTVDGSDVAEDYYSWYIRITRILVGNPIYRGHVDEGYSITGSSAVILTNAAEASLRICEEQLKNISEPSDQISFSRIKYLLTRGLAAIGSRIGHHEVTCVVTGSQNVVHPSKGPKNRIFTRGAKGVKRGGKQCNFSRRANDVDSTEVPEDDEVFGFGSTSQPPRECLTLEYVCGSASTSQENPSQENVIRSGSGSQPSHDSTIEEIIPHTRTRPRRARKTVNRYTPG